MVTGGLLQLPAKVYRLWSNRCWTAAIAVRHPIELMHYDGLKEDSTILINSEFIFETNFCAKNASLVRSDVAFSLHGL